MSIALSSFRRRRLLYLLERPRFLRRFSAEPYSPLAIDKLESEESVAVQFLEQLRRIPQCNWASCETLESLLISSSSASPRVFSQITWRLESYSLALSFLDYLREKVQSLKHHEESLSLAFQSVIEIASREPDSRDKLLQLYEDSKENKIPLTINAAKFLIRLFGHLGMVNQSVLVYEELDRTMKNTHIRNVVINVLLNDGRMDEAFKVLDEMLQKESDFPPNEITRDIVFHVVSRESPTGRHASDEEIVGLISKFGAHGVFPRSVWLTRFIASLCKKRLTDEAWATLMELMDQGAPLEAPPFNALLTHLGKNMDISRMSALAQKMNELKVRSDGVTMGILINSLCKSRKIYNAIEIFEEMCGKETKDGDVIKPDEIHYNTLIDGLVKVGRMDKAELLLKKMKQEEGINPNIITYNSLINGYCRAGQVDKAKTVVSKMKEEGIRPNVVTLNTLVMGMCRNHGVGMAVQFFMDMQRDGLKGNVVTYTQLVYAYCNVNNIDMAMHWFNKMSEAGCSPDAKFYYTLIFGLCGARRDRDAVGVVEKMKSSGFSLDLVAYNMLIKLFCSKNKPGKAYEMLASMEETGVKPDPITYNTLISYFSKHKDFETIERVLKKMREDGLAPTAVTYGAIIRGYCSAGDMDEAMRLFEDMGSRSNVLPNTEIYNILISAFCGKGNIPIALSLKDDMKVKRISLNVETYNALFKGLKDTNRLETVHELMDEMKENSVEPDYSTVEVLTEILSTSGQLEEFQRFMQAFDEATTTTTTTSNV